MRSQESDKAAALVSLRKDLVNGPLHVFGIHTNCSPDFCTTKQQQQQQPGQTENGDEVPTDDEDCDDGESPDGGSESDPDGTSQNL